MNNRQTERQNSFAGFMLPLPHLFLILQVNMKRKKARRKRKMRKRERREREKERVVKNEWKKEIKTKKEYFLHFLLPYCFSLSLEKNPNFRYSNPNIIIAFPLRSDCTLRFFNTFLPKRLLFSAYCCYF